MGSRKGKPVAGVLAGIIVIAAVPGKEQVGGFPASVSGVIAVRQGNGIDNVNKLEVFAPGKDILTTVPHQAYDFMTGSSFATPHVAGMVALMLQLYPDWQVADVKKLFSSNFN